MVHTMAKAIKVYNDRETIAKRGQFCHERGTTAAIGEASMKETMGHPLSGMGAGEIGELCYEWGIALRASVADSRQYWGKDNNGGMRLAVCWLEKGRTLRAKNTRE
jgi:hypothetical protein